MRRLILAGGLALGLLAGPAVGQEPAPQDLAVEPEAIAALERMGARLVALESFALGAETQAEIVLDSGQKLLIGGKVRYRVRRPDHLRIDLVTDVLHREFYYDGRTAQYVAPEDGYYAVIEDAPPTIRDMLARAAQDYALAFPLADLFAWGTEEAPVASLSEAFRVGPAPVGGVAATHWAYRAADQDVEVWIRDGDDPLPLRISTVDRADPTRPRFNTTLDWSAAPPEAADFVFSPGAAMMRIPFATAGSPGEGRK